MSNNTDPIAYANSRIGSKVIIILKDDVEFEGILQGFDEYMHFILDDVTQINKFNNTYSKKHHNSMILNGNGIAMIVFSDNN